MLSFFPPCIMIAFSLSFPLLFLFSLVSISPFIASSSASSSFSSPVVTDPPIYFWYSSSNVTVGTSAEPTSPYLLLSIPISVAQSSAFLNFQNLHPNLSISLLLDSVPYDDILLPSQSFSIPLVNCTFSTFHNFSILSHPNRSVLLSGLLSGLCVDCVGNLTFTDQNVTTWQVEQPTYALEYTDRDSDVMYTTNYIQPIYPTSSSAALASCESFNLSFTFTVPIASFNFYPVYLLRLLPSSSFVSRHPPLSSSYRQLSPPLLHVPYYYTDIILPFPSIFDSGDVLTVKGGFSTNPNDLYCCNFANAEVSYFSKDCLPANASDTFYCTVPSSVATQGWDGETLTVVGTYHPKPPSTQKGYFMRHLKPSGGSDNTFTVDKPAPVRQWWDIRGWEMQAIIVGGGVAMLLLSGGLGWRGWKTCKERKQRRAMEARAADETVAEEGDDLTIAIAISASLNYQQPYYAQPAAVADVKQMVTNPIPTQAGRVTRAKGKQRKKREESLRLMDEPLLASSI